MTSILSQDPASGTVPYQEVVYYDDGTEPLGTVTEVIGGSNSRNISRQENLVYDPRLLSNSVSPSQASFGSNARHFVSDLANSIDPGDPVISARQFILGDQGEYRRAIRNLSADPTINRIAENEAAFGLSQAQVLGEVVRSGIGAGVLRDASRVANTVGLSTGRGVVGVEVGATALTLGAIAHVFDDITGNHTIYQVENNAARAWTNYAHESIRHSTF